MRPTLKRPNIVQTALNDAELAALRKQADREGLSVTAYIRRLVIASCFRKRSSVGPVDPPPPEAPAEE